MGTVVEIDTNPKAHTAVEFRSLGAMARSLAEDGPNSHVCDENVA
jgi:hypothetical protein